MKKAFIILTTLIVMGIGGVWGYYTIINHPDTLSTFLNKTTPDGNYMIKKSGKIIEETDSKEEAIKKADELERSVVIDKKSNKWIYSTFSPFIIITDTAIHDFEIFDNAIRYAKKNGYHQIYYNSDSKPIWDDEVKLPLKANLKVPFIRQLPELPRGCEVTSLAMIFAYYGQNVSKMELANDIKRDTTPYQVDIDGLISYGNPYEGFVGDMYNIQNNGYGVYHGPIAELSSLYFKEKVIDLTGLEFKDVLSFISKGYPVWIITNATYKPLDETYFRIWHTPTGIVKITNKLHAVVITGYDEEKVYFNNPLDTKANSAMDRNSFQKAWEQMGNQAVTIIK